MHFAIRDPTQGVPDIVIAFFLITSNGSFARHFNRRHPSERPDGYPFSPYEATQPHQTHHLGPVLVCNQKEERTQHKTVAESFTSMNVS